MSKNGTIRSFNSSSRPVMQRLFLPIALLILILTALPSGLLWQQYQQKLVAGIEELALDIAGDMRVALDHQIFGLAMATQPIAAEPEVQRALREGDSDSLMTSWGPVFEAMSRDHKLSHFYFLDKNRICLLRVHKPAKRGDKIDRFTALEAERTGKAASGIELGPLGTFTLRVVQPVFENGITVGYVELGKEIEDVLQALNFRPGTQLAVIIRKEFLDRKTWEDGMRMLGREADWERMSDSVVIYASQGRLPDAFAATLHRDKKDEYQPGRIGGEVLLDGGSWHLCTLPLKDAAGKEVGDLLVMDDVSGEKANFLRFMILGGAAGILTLTLLVGILYVILRSTDANIIAQQAILRVSEETYRKQFSENSAIMLLIDPADASIIDANAAAVAFYGYSRERLLGMRITEIDTLPAPEVEKIVAAVAAGKGSRFSFQHRLANGSLRDVDVAVSNIQYGERSIINAIIFDITDRKKAEAALKESEKRFMDVFYSSRDAVLIIDGNIFVDCNEATARMLGYPTRKEFLMTHPSKLSPDTQPDGQKSFGKAEEMMKIAMEKGYNRFEWMHRKAGGEDFLVEVSLTPISLHGKTVIHCLWRDLTELKNMEREAKSRIHELEIFYRASMGREDRIIELKREIDKLNKERL